MFLRNNVKKYNTIVHVQVQNKIQGSHGNECCNYDLLAHDVAQFGTGTNTLKESGASICFIPGDGGSKFLKMLVDYDCNVMTHRNAMEEK